MHFKSKLITKNDNDWNTNKQPVKTSKKQSKSTKNHANQWKSIKKTEDSWKNNNKHCKLIKKTINRTCIILYFIAITCL